MESISRQVSGLQEQAPVFIGGPERSGKTYMRFMLAAHPNIAVSRRTNMWTYYYGNFGDLSRDGNLQRCLETMMQRQHIQRLAPDVERIRREFKQGPQTYSQLFALMHIHYAEREGKTRWGDQTELIERSAESIFSAYPNAKMIQMIRDPRDRYEAICVRNPQAPGRVGKAVAKWLYSEALARQNSQKFPDKYLIVRYESMVSDPERTMRDVCRFLDEPFTLDMVTLPDVTRFNQGRDVPVESRKSPLTTDYIGRYRQRLTTKEIAFIQSQAGSRMLNYGYKLDPIQFSIIKKLQFYLGLWGLNVAQMVGWRALQSMRARRSIWDRYNSQELQHVSTGTAH